MSDVDLHARCRALVLEGDANVDTVVDHLDACPTCADLAHRVSAIRRLAPTLASGGSPPADLADRTIARVRTESPGGIGSTRLRRGRLTRTVAPRAAAAVAVAAVAMFVLLPVVTNNGSGVAGATELSNALLVSAQRTQQAGTARLRLHGSSQVLIDGVPVDVEFGGVGELADARLHYRGVTQVANRILPSELTVVGPDAWMRRGDGTWLQVSEPMGALAPLVLDAGSVLELLRLPKQDLHLVEENATTREVAFTVTARPGLRYAVLAWVGRSDDLLRRVDITTTGVGWRTAASMQLYGFGQAVAIHAPAAGDVVGRWEMGTDGAAAQAAYPIG